MQVGGLLDNDCLLKLQTIYPHLRYLTSNITPKSRGEHRLKLGRRPERMSYLPKNLKYYFAQEVVEMNTAQNRGEDSIQRQCTR